jgi:hypothetical protein
VIEIALLATTAAAQPVAAAERAFACAAQGAIVR